MHDLGGWRAARAALQRSLTIRERILASPREDIAQSLNSLAKLALDEGDLAEACTCAERAVSMLVAIFGGEHPKTARRVHTLGRVMLALGDARDALLHMQRALSTRERLLAPRQRGYRRTS